MIVGLGVDVLEVSRMERALRAGDPGFTRDLFTSDEIADCARRREPARHFAGRFALKEAVFKALSLETEPGPRWRDIELRLENGIPMVVLHGALEELAFQRGVDRVFVSLTHAQGLAIAGAILESGMSVDTSPIGED